MEGLRQLALPTKGEVSCGGISTVVGLARGPVANELEMLWLSCDTTTQKPRSVEVSILRPAVRLYREKLDRRCEELAHAGACLPRAPTLCVAATRHGGDR